MDSGLKLFRFLQVTFSSLIQLISRTFITTPIDEDQLDASVISISANSFRF